MNTKVEKNKYGFYNLKTIPSHEELKEYYSKKYFVPSKGHAMYCLCFVLRLSS